MTIGVFKSFIDFLRYCIEVITIVFDNAKGILTVFIMTNEKDSFLVETGIKAALKVFFLFFNGITIGLRLRVLGLFGKEDGWSIECFIGLKGFI